MTDLEINFEQILRTLQDTRITIQGCKSIKKQKLLSEIDAAIGLVKSQLSVKVTNKGGK